MPDDPGAWITAGDMLGSSVNSAGPSAAKSPDAVNAE